MWFFTMADPAAPCIGERAADDTWNTKARLAFARDAADALADLHRAGENGEPMLHRNLTPDTVLVRHDNTPILTGFHYARIPADVTVADSERHMERGEQSRWRRRFVRWGSGGRILDPTPTRCPPVCPCCSRSGMMKEAGKREMY